MQISLNDLKTDFDINDKKCSESSYGQLWKRTNCGKIGKNRGKR